MPGPALIPEVTINGTFGKLYDENNVFLTNVQHIDGKVTTERREIRMAGQRGVGYKMLGVTGEGTMTQFKVTSAFLARITNPMRNPKQRMFVGELRYVLDDPEALGVEEVRLKRVKFWDISFGYQINELVQESIPFTFEDIELVQQITGDPTQVAAIRT